MSTLFNILNVSSESIDDQETYDPMVVDVADEELQQINTDQDESGTAIEMIEGARTVIQDTGEVTQEIIERQGTLSEEGYNMLRTVGMSIGSHFGLSSPKLAMESHHYSYNEYSVIAMEGIGDLIKTAVKKIIEFIKKIGQAIANAAKWVVDFIKKLFGGKKKEVEKVKKQLDENKTKSGDKAKEFDLTKFSAKDIYKEDGKYDAVRNDPTNKVGLIVPSTELVVVVGMFKNISDQDVLPNKFGVMDFAELGSNFNMAIDIPTGGKFVSRIHGNISDKNYSEIPKSIKAFARILLTIAAGHGIGGWKLSREALDAILSAEDASVTLSGLKWERKWDDSRNMDKFKIVAEDVFKYYDEMDKAFVILKSRLEEYTKTFNSIRSDMNTLGDEVNSEDMKLINNAIKSLVWSSPNRVVGWAVKAMKDFSVILNRLSAAVGKEFDAKAYDHVKDVAVLTGDLAKAQTGF